LIDLLEAKKLVYREINEPDLSWPDKPEMIILDELTVEKDYGWVFYWTSRPWRETGDFQFAIAGNGPILVSRETGAIYSCGTSAPIEDRIKEQEQLLLADLKTK
jgi:hypothetical protein